MAVGHRLGGGRRGAGPTGRGRPAHRHRQVAAVLELCYQARVPVTAAGGRSGVCGASVPLFGGRGPRPVRAGRHRSGWTPTRWSPTSGPAPSGPTWSPDCERLRASHSATGRSRWTCPRSADGWPAGGPGSTRTATGRSRTWSSASRWCWPTAGWSGPAGTGPGRPPARTSPSCSWAARAPSGSSPKAGSGSIRFPRARAGGRSGSPPSPRVWTPVDESCGGAPPRPSSASTTRTESGRSFDLPDTNVLVVLDEADPGLVEATLAVVDQECAAPPSWRGAWSTAGWATATTSRPWPRSGAAGVVVDTVEVSARWSALPGLYDAVLEALGGVRAHWSPRPTSPTPTPTGPASTSPSPVDRPRRWTPTTPSGPRRVDGDYYRQAWDGSPGQPRTPGGPSATTTASASTGPASCAVRSDRVRGAGLGQGGPRPPRHPQPGQARTHRPLRPGALAMSILVVDVGTSGVRGAVVRPDGR